jgi:hypothetical protein
MQNNASGWNTLSEGLMGLGTSGLLSGGQTNGSVINSLGQGSGRGDGNVTTTPQHPTFSQGTNFGTIPFNPSQTNNIPGLYQYLNRPR